MIRLPFLTRLKWLIFGVTATDFMKAAHDAGGDTFGVLMAWSLDYAVRQGWVSECIAEGGQ